MGHTDYVHMDFLLIHAAIKKIRTEKAEKTMKTEMNTRKSKKTEEPLKRAVRSTHRRNRAAAWKHLQNPKMSSFAFVLLRTKRQMVQCVYEPAYARFAWRN